MEAVFQTDTTDVAGWCKMGLRSTVRALGRFGTVAWAALPFLVAALRDRRRFILFGRPRSIDRATQRRRAERLLDTLIELGPTFIKLGQLLSTRPDVLPPVYIEVLSRLQDDVPPAPWAKARAIVESDLGPIDDRFDEIEATAISGASLGQVHRGTIDGESVAVKIRRPGVERLVAADLKVIRWTLTLVLPLVDDARAFSVRNLADEFAVTIRQEMDYQRERAMLEEIRANFADDDGVRIPTVREEYCTARVLTMEYVPGTKITDVETLEERGIDRTAVAERLQQAYFKMIVDDGVFHADPHPGNLAVQDDGTIVFYDFGMSGRVDAYLQGKIVEFYVAVANRDIDGILDVLIEVGTLSPEADREVMGEVMELAIEDARGREVEQYRIQRIITRIEDSIYEFPFRLPAELALILRVATVAEGVCVTLDPDYDFVAVASEYLVEEGYHEEGLRRYLVDRRDELVDAAESAVRLPPKLEDTLDRIERDDLAVEAIVRDDKRELATFAKRVILGLVLSSTIITAGLGATFNAMAVVYWSIAGGGIAAVLLWRSFRQPSGIRARPQFTRRNLARRRETEPGEHDRRE